MAVAIRGLLDRMIPKYCYVRPQRHGPSRLRPGPWKAGVVERPGEASRCGSLRTAEDGDGLRVARVRDHVHHRERLHAIAAGGKLLGVTPLRRGIA